MARPYQFSDPDQVTSPLDRRPPVTIQPSEAPAAFRQNMNRNKTKKWVDAKTYNYDGDDWGDYDQDDEYGADEHAQSTKTTGLQRASSFERGDEKRTFSAATSSATSAGPNAFNNGLNRAQESTRSVSGQSVAPTESSDVSSNVPEHRRDYSPSAMPQPLSSARTASRSPAPGDLQQRSSSASRAYDPRENAAAQPFVRPADIYKRMEEARSQESLAKASNDKLRENAAAMASKSNLANIPERKSEYGMLDAKAAQTLTDKYRLPDVAPESSFADDMWSPASVKSVSETKTESNMRSPTSITSSRLDPTSPTNDVPSRAPSQGFKSMVNRAFEPSGLLGGVSKQDSLRSQRTDASRGTSDISPILASVRESGDHTTENILNLYSDDEPMTPSVHETSLHETPKASEHADRSDLDSSETTLSASKELPPPPQHDVPSATTKSLSPEKPLPIPQEKDKAALPIRPKIPGQFDSYAFASSTEPTPFNELPGAKYFAQTSKETESVKTAPASSEVPDFSPSSNTKAHAGAPDKMSMAGLSAAGAAMGAALEQAFRVEPKRTTDSTRAAVENSSVPPSPPAKDTENPLDHEIAPLVPLKTNKPVTSEPAPETSTGAVLQSTAIAPSIATAQSNIAPPESVVVPAQDESAPPASAALPPIYTSMLDVGQPERSMLDVEDLPKKLTLDTDGLKKETIVTLPLAEPKIEEDNVASAPKINRQFSWETDIPTASDAVLSPVGTETMAGESVHEHGESVAHVVSPIAHRNSQEHQRQVDTSAPTRSSVERPVSHGAEEISRSDFNDSQPMRPVTEKNERLPSFKEITMIRSTPDRLAAYDSTREEWLHMDAGLSTWLAATLEQLPEHGYLREQTAKPFDGPSALAAGSRRSHMRAGSIGGIGKLFTHGGASSYNTEHASPDQEKRTSGGAMGGAGKTVGDTLKGLGGKSKGLIGKIKASRKKEDDGY